MYNYPPLCSASQHLQSNISPMKENPIKMKVLKEGGTKHFSWASHKVELQNIFDRNTGYIWFSFILVLNIFRFSTYGSVPLICQYYSWTVLYMPKITLYAYRRRIWALLSNLRERLILKRNKNEDKDILHTDIQADTKGQNESMLQAVISSLSCFSLAWSNIVRYLFNEKIHEKFIEDALSHILL